MTVHFYDSCNASLEKGRKMAPSSSMIQNMLCVFVSRKRECEPAFIYTAWWPCMKKQLLLPYRSYSLQSCSINPYRLFSYVYIQAHYFFQENYLMLNFLLFLAGGIEKVSRTRHQRGLQLTWIIVYPFIFILRLAPKELKQEYSPKSFTSWEI